MTRREKLTVKVCMDMALVCLCVWSFIAILSFCHDCARYAWDSYRTEYHREQGFIREHEMEKAKMEKKTESNDVYKWCFDNRLTSIGAGTRNVVFIGALCLEVCIVLFTVYLIHELWIFFSKKLDKLLRESIEKMKSEYKKLKLRMKEKENVKENLT